MIMSNAQIADTVLRRTTPAECAEHDAADVPSASAVAAERASRVSSGGSWSPPRSAPTPRRLGSPRMLSASRRGSWLRLWSLEGRSGS